MEMDLDLYPSEIARLVLAYVQEQNLEAAAKVFLDSSPDLGEHRAVTTRNGTYGKKCNYKYQCKLSLLDILHEYCQINKLVSDKIREATDYEQLKNKTLTEQIKYLLEGPRGNVGFVVNISVPPQSTPGNSKSIRKRNHSSNEHGKVAKSLNLEKPALKDCDKLEKSFENIPPHQTSTPSKLPVTEAESNVNSVNNTISSDPKTVAVSPKKVESSLVENIVNLETSTDKGSANSNKEPSAEPLETVQSKDVEAVKEKSNEVTSVEKCSTGTSTEPLLDYSSTQVQTTPPYFLECEPVVLAEPVQNLSIIHNELLKSQEKLQKLTEGINKSFQLGSQKENNAADQSAHTLLTVDSAIKSITEDDQLVDSLLRGLFEVEAVPEQVEDSNLSSYQQFHQSQPDQQNEVINDNNVVSNGLDEPAESEIEASVPIKQRLRGSLKPQIHEEEKDALLENQNAEAIQNIVNVIANKKSLNKDETKRDEHIVSDGSSEITSENLCSSPPRSEDVEGENKSEQSVSKNAGPETTKTKKPRKSLPKSKSGVPEEAKKRKKRVPKPKSEVVVENPDRHVQTMPLIVCAEKQGFSPTSSPKQVDPSVFSPVPSISYKTVDVPCHLLTAAQIETTAINPLIQKTVHQSLYSPHKQTLLFSPQTKMLYSHSPKLSNRQVILTAPLNEPIVLPVNPANTTTPQDTHITLYGTDNSAEARIAPLAGIPIITVDQDCTFDFSGTGLSPFFKQTASGNIVAYSEDRGVNSPRLAMIMEAPTEEVTKSSYNFDERVSDAEPPAQLMENPESAENNEVLTEVNTNSQDDVSLNRSSAADVITKNTPRTLMMARSQNAQGRLSLSTPRRRNSHVRALNFNTPMKLTADAAALSQQKAKSVCRGSLFKSPPFSGEIPPFKLDPIPEENSSISANRVKTLSPVKKVAASMSPTPKLQGNWGKVSGMGMILGESSPEKSSEPVQVEGELKKSSKKSWDEDLRNLIGAVEEAPKSTRSRRRRKKSVSTTDAEPKSEEVAEKPKRAGRKRKISTKNEDENKAEEVESEEPPTPQEPEAIPAKRKRVTKAKKSEDNSQTDKKTEPKKKTQEVKKEKKPPAEPVRRRQTRSKKLNNPPPEEKPSEKAKTKNVQITPPASIPVSKTSSEKKQYFKSPEVLSLRVDAPNLPALDLETPQKTESELTIPATPRVLYTPADSLMKSSRNTKSTYSDGKSIKCGVDTPCIDYPPKTPNVILTPKIVDEDDEKKSSPYYEPSEEPKSKEVVEPEKVMVQQSVQKNFVELNDNQAIEITRYGVVENNIVLNDTNDSVSSQNTEDEDEEEIEKAEPLDNHEDEVPENINHSTSTDTDSDDDSDKSNTSSSSSSSSCSSSSSSSNDSSNSSSSSSSSSGSSNDSSFSSPEKSADVEEPQLQQTDHETEESEMDIRLQQDSSHDERDCDSPKKVFPIAKDPAEEEIKETPAKDENAELEARISETPSVSETERANRLSDTMTNLTSKISAIITTSRSDRSVEKVKSVFVEKQDKEKSFSPSPTKKPAVSKKPRIISNELLETKNRVMERLKTDQKPSGNTRQKKVAAAKKNPETDKLAGPLAVENPKSKSIAVSKKEEKVESNPVKLRTSPRKAMKQNDQNPVDNIETKLEKMFSEPASKAPKAAVSIPVVAEICKGIPKSKVDQVKRDLFSDDEANDQRTTRSKSARKSTVVNHKVEESLDLNTEEQVPGILQCLALMPANKNNNAESKSADQVKISEEPSNVAEFNCWHDETFTVSKSPEEISDNDLSFQIENELYTLRKSEYVILCDMPSMPDIGSPLKVTKVANQKVPSPKKSPVKKRDKVPEKDAESVNFVQSSKSPKIKHKNTLSEKNKKASKRKLPSSKENDEDKKKSKPDPTKLLEKLKIDEFLNTLHTDN